MHGKNPLCGKISMYYSCIFNDEHLLVITDKIYHAKIKSLAMKLHPILKFFSFGKANPKYQNLKSPENLTLVSLYYMLTHSEPANDPSDENHGHRRVDLRRSNQSEGESEHATLQAKTTF